MTSILGLVSVPADVGCKKPQKPSAAHKAQGNNGHHRFRAASHPFCAIAAGSHNVYPAQADKQVDQQVDNTVGITAAASAALPTNQPTDHIGGIEQQLQKLVSPAARKG